MLNGRFGFWGLNIRGATEGSDCDRGKVATVKAKGEWGEVPRCNSRGRNR